MIKGHSVHRDFFLSDGGQAVEDILKRPLAMFVLSIPIKERLQFLFQMPLQVVSEHANKDMTADAIIGFMKNRTNF